MKISVFDGKAVQKIRDNKNIVFLVIAIVGFCVFQGYYSNQFTYDDGYLTERFSMMINEYGIFGTIFREFLNMDLAWCGELRFYGLSKAIHVIIYFFAREHTGVYQFIIAGMHFASGILLYKIVDFWGYDNTTKFMCVIAWWFSPFAHIQTFHHFSYLFLPLYFVMGYTYFNLNGGKSVNNGLLNGFINGLLIFCCIFTGENTIPLLGMIILIFIMWGMVTKKGKIVKKYIVHLCLSVILGVSWIMLWENKICVAENGRFSNPELSFSQLHLLIRDFMSSLAYFLWLGPFRYEGDWKTDFSGGGVFVVLFFVASIIYTSYRCMNRNVTKAKTKLPIYVFLVGAFICFFGMTIIYVMLNVFKGYRLENRYFYTIYTVILCIIIILLNYISSMRVRRVINIGIIFVLIGLNIFWYGILLPQYARRNWEVERHLEKICDQYDTIVVVTEGENPVYGKVIERGYYYRPKSAFSEAWATESFVNNYFDKVIFVPETISVKFDYKNIYLENAMIVYEQEELESMTVGYENTCFMYLDNENQWQVTNFDEFYGQKANQSASSVL